MAEFCIDCWNEINETNDSEKKYIISEDLVLCEGCNEYKHIIVANRKSYYMRKFRFLILPFKIIYIILYIILRILISPYLIYKYIKHKKQ